MGMLCMLSRVTEDEMAALREDSTAADQLLHEPCLVAPPKPGFLARLFGPAPPAPPVPRARRSWIGAERQYDLDKRWHVVHYLLTGLGEGGEFPACFLCNDGEEVGEDFGYGRPRLFTSAQAAAIAAHLHGLDEAALLARYDAADMENEDIYWQPATSPEERREDVASLHETIGEIARFADEAARSRNGLVVDIY